MRTLTEIWTELNARGYGSDKGGEHSYLPIYEMLLEPYRKRPAIRMLEIGVFRGHSLRLWREYFGPSAEIHGADIDVSNLAGNVAAVARLYVLDASDRNWVQSRFWAQPFDVIVDDGSHALSDQLAAYENLTGLLAPGGVYVIEDVQDIHAARQSFLALDRKSYVVDLRGMRNRFDDVMVVIPG